MNNITKWLRNAYDDDVCALNFDGNCKKCVAREMCRDDATTCGDSIRKWGLFDPETDNKIEETDAVNHPPHYNVGNIEVIDAIDDWGLGFCLGNVVKYIARAGRKGDKLEDLKKARWYIDHEIERLNNA